MIRKYSQLLLLLLISSIASNSYTDEIPHNQMTDDNQEYICNELATVRDAINNAYCSSSADSGIKKDCDVIAKLENSCSVERATHSVVFIHLDNIDPESAVPNKTKPLDKIHETPQLKELNLQEEINKALQAMSEDISEEQSPQLSIKCANTLANKWVCGLYSSTYRHSILSEENTIKRQILYSELFDKASSCISKI